MTFIIVGDVAKQWSQNQLYAANNTPEPPVNTWFESPRGRLLLQREGAQLRKVLPGLFGYRLLQIGDWGLERELLASSATLCQWVVGQGSNGPVDVLFNGTSLPLSSRSLDAVVLPHSLESVDSPHQLLREVDRVLCDHGHVVVLGFNPYSVQTLRYRWGKSLRGRRFYPLGRVCDWLELLDYDLISAARFGVGFPYLPAGGVDIGSGGLWRLPGVLAQAYAMVARKRVIARTPRQQSKATARIPTRGMPEPSTFTNYGRSDTSKHSA